MRAACAHVMVPFFLRAKDQKGDHNIGAARRTTYFVARCDTFPVSWRCRAQRGPLGVHLTRCSGRSPNQGVHLTRCLRTLRLPGSSWLYLFTARKERERIEKGEATREARGAQQTLRAWLQEVPFQAPLVAARGARFT